MRWSHQGILPAEIAHVFGNPAPAGKTHCLAGGTHCSPCILHKWNAFHIHQEVWEILFSLFSVILLLHLAISHLPSGDTFLFPDESWPHEASWGALCHPHCLKSPIWSHLARIIQWFEGYGPANWKNRGRWYWQKTLCFADVVMMLMMVLMEMPPPCLICPHPDIFPFLNASFLSTA